MSISMKSNEPVHIQVNANDMTICGISDAGRLRSENQDAIFLDEDGNFMLLADGMGGHERGAEASETALGIIQRYLTPEAITAEIVNIDNGNGIPVEISSLLSLVDTAVKEANSTLYRRNQSQGVKRYMGTTVVGLVMVDGCYVLWFHVGDSRLYRWRNSNLESLTVDHSAYEQWLRNGRLGLKPGRNVITKAIGPTVATSADIMWDKCERDDTYILCCDGLTDMISEREIARILTAEKNVTAVADRLVSAANDAGGKDNISVVVCRV
jgi:protein phosphatase